MMFSRAAALVYWIMAGGLLAVSYFPGLWWLALPVMPLAFVAGLIEGEHV
jgi:hypothetical protein